MTYRADPLTQRDGSTLASSNCRPTSIAVGLDYQELGEKTSSGAAMRSFMDDQSGGTDSSDARQAWSRGYGEELVVRDGSTWADLEADLAAGRLVHVDVWHASAGGPCLSGSGAYGHTMAIAPERSGTRWLVCDPWCNPPKWTWWEVARLRAGAEEWGRRIGVSTAGRRRLVGAELVAAMRAKGRRLMTLYRPGRPMPSTFPRGAETSGAPRIMYTATAAPGAAGGADMAIGAAGGLGSSYRAHAGKGLTFYADANLTERLGQLGAEAELAYVGNPIGETGGTAKAVIVGTGTVYSDGVARPTVVYVQAQYLGEPYLVDEPGPPSGDDIAAAIAARDDEWAAALIAGEAWPSSSS